MEYDVAIGLEVHVQLRTKSKMFCGCGLDFGAPPNTLTCPVCLGYPGSLPVMNEEAVRLTVKSGLMLGCDINAYSKFDRKSYFYPDMPKNYQISQYDKPLCLGGTVEAEVDGTAKTFQLTRIHLEEDVAKSMHFAGTSGVDFNRAGTPLMEIVTEPDITTPDEALAFLHALKQILLYGEVSNCNLEEGNMRCDVNCSVRPSGRDELGTKTELKNLNTFKGVHSALQYEIARQIDLCNSGGSVIQETRRWDTDTGTTASMRTKEYAHDYRYFPEPDLMPVRLSNETISELASEIPELPQHRRERFVADHGLPEYDARVLAADRAVADFFEETVAGCPNPKSVSNWIMTEVLHHLSATESEIASMKLTPAALRELVIMVDDGAVNSTSAKEILGELLENGGNPVEVASERGLSQVSDSGELESFVNTAIDENPKSVEDYRGGKKAALQFLMGQVMRMSRGKANPQMVMELLRKHLD